MRGNQYLPKADYAAQKQSDCYEVYLVEKTFYNIHLTCNKP